jgi:uncharacterized integral membrane protein
MIFYLVVVLAVSIAAAVFAVSNASPVSVNLIFWQLQDVSLALVILVSAAVGIAVSSAIAVYVKINDAMKIRSLESRVRELDRQATQRGLPLQ